MFYSFHQLRLTVLLWVMTLSVIPALAQPQIIHYQTTSDTVAALETFEIKVEAQAGYSNPYDPTQVTIMGTMVTPQGDTLSIPGFAMQDFLFQGPDNLIPQGGTVWKIRFSPEYPGLHSWRLMLTDTSGADTTAWQTFICADTLRNGFVRPGKGLYLEHDRGKQFFPVGENMAWSVPEGTYAAYETWIDSLTSYGGNFIKVMMVPWSLSLEWNNTGLGNYTMRQDRARHLDWLLDLCRDKGVYVQLCFMIHDELTSSFNNTWAQNPYNAALGGPCQTPIQFFTDTTAKELFRQRLAYIMARWGHHPAILSWEILSEADRVEAYSSNKAVVTTWLRDISSWLRQNDRHNRMVTAGFAASENDPFFWADTGTAYTQLHIYSMIPDLEAEVYTTALDYIETFQKKYILGEYALSHHPDTVFAYDPDGIAFRNSLWTTALSGSMGCGKTWWWDNYIHPNGHYKHFQGIAGFMQYYGALDEHHLPVCPLILTPDHDTLVVQPRFLDLFAKAPEAVFEVEPGGMLFPISKRLGKYLYGKGFLMAPFRNPPTFKVNYPEAGYFAIHTGNYVPAPSLSVSIDGVMVWTSVVQPNAVYQVPVDSGFHQILVENAGNDNTVCEIEAYHFHPYRSEARAFAIRGQESMAGWIQRQDFHWPQWYTQPNPAPLQDAFLVLDDLSDSLYVLEWLDPWTGQPMSATTYQPTGQRLKIPVPPFSHDLAFILKPGAWSGMDDPGAGSAGFRIHAWPNPSAGVVHIRAHLQMDIPLRLDILDTTGRVIQHLYQGKPGLGQREWIWDPSQSAAPPGLYLCRAISGQTTHTIKLIIR